MNLFQNPLGVGFDSLAVFGAFAGSAGAGTGDCDGESGATSKSGVTSTSMTGGIRVAPAGDVSAEAGTVARSFADGTSAKTGNVVRNSALNAMSVRLQEFIEN
jgi:hypothetical protein